jgi:hypothetical protein
VRCLFLRSQVLHRIIDGHRRCDEAPGIAGTDSAQGPTLTLRARHGPALLQACFALPAPTALSGPCLTAARTPSRLQQNSFAKPRPDNADFTRKLVPSNSLAGTAPLAVSEARAAGARAKMNGTRPGTRSHAKFAVSRAAARARHMEMLAQKSEREAAQAAMRAEDEAKAEKAGGSQASSRAGGSRGGEPRGR